MKQKALRAGDAHSHEDEECRKRLRSARECTEVHSFLLYRKDRLRRSLELKKGPHGGGHNKQTIDGLEDIETFFTEIVIKFVII